MSDSRGKDRGSNELVLSALVNHLVANQKEVKFLMFMGRYGRWVVMTILILLWQI